MHLKGTRFFTHEVSKLLQGKRDHRGKYNYFFSFVYLDGQFFLCLTVYVNGLKYVYRVAQKSLDV